MIYHVLILNDIDASDCYCEDVQNVHEVAEHCDDEQEEDDHEGEEVYDEEEGDDNEDLNAVEITEHQPPHLHINVFLANSQKVARKSGNYVFLHTSKITATTTITTTTTTT